MNQVSYDESCKILQEVEATVVENHPIQQLLAKEPTRYALAQLQADAEMDTGLPNTDHRISMLCMNCFRLGAYMALVQEAISPDEQEKARRCLNCQSLKMTSGVLRCKLQKCKYE